MGPLAEKHNERYTYSDYLKWDDGERWELIDGVAYWFGRPDVYGDEEKITEGILFGSGDRSSAGFP